MLEIFADGISAITAVNGVVRLELTQIRRARSGDSQLAPEPVATLLVPVSSFKEFTVQFANTLKRIEDERVVYLRYEELISDPAGSLERLCRGCRLRWDPEASRLVLNCARARLRSAEPHWSRLHLVTRSYTLRVIRDLQRNLGYPMAL